MGEKGLVDPAVSITVQVAYASGSYGLARVAKEDSLATGHDSVQDACEEPLESSVLLSNQLNRLVVLTKRERYKRSLHEFDSGAHNYNSMFTWFFQERPIVYLSAIIKRRHCQDAESQES